MQQVIENKQFDEERALYHLIDTTVDHCTFAGPADGESVLKESRDIQVAHCSFSLRYPLWHVDGFELTHSEMDELTRAAIWYAKRGVITDSKLGGIKAVRECSDITIKNCQIDSPEFGWKCDRVHMEDSEVTAEYLFLDCKDISLKNVHMHGKYSFQYIDHLTIEDSILDTKDAFWHSKHVTVKNSIVKGEYLAWFSEDLTLINCKIIGTQPLCYCKGLKLVNCTMEDTDLSFEYSEVEADVKGSIISVKNPKEGTIIADEIGEIIWDDPIMPCNGVVKIRA